MREDKIGIFLFFAYRQNLIESHKQLFDIVFLPDDYFSFDRHLRSLPIRIIFLTNKQILIDRRIHDRIDIFFVILTIAKLSDIPYQGHIALIVVKIDL